MFVIPMIIFGVGALATLKFFSDRYAWRGIKETEKRDVLKWAVYGVLIPAWIELCMIYSYVNLLMTSIVAGILGFTIAASFTFCKRRNIQFFPIPAIATIVVFAAAVYTFSPPSPENWSTYFNIGIKANELIYFYFWSAPPWIVGMAYLRSNLKSGYVVLPAAIFAYIVMWFISLPISSKIGYEISTAAVYVIVILILYVIVRRVAYESVQD